MKDLDPESFDQVEEGVWLVDFWADWCGPCKRMEPELEDAEEQIDAEIGKVNMGDHGGLGSQHGVRSLPTTVLFVDGEEVARNSGYMDSDSIKEFVENGLEKA